MWSPAFQRVSAPNSAPSQTAFVLHGILGSGRNWRSFCRRLAQTHPDWQFILVDHRNHGDSGEGPGDDSVAQTAADLEQIVAQVGSPQMVLGHSFGGKIALQWAAHHARQDLDAVWVLDSFVGTTSAPPTEEDSDVLRVLAALRQVPIPTPDRRDVRASLRASGFSESLVAWVLTNLQRDAHDQWHWKPHLDGVQRMITDYFEQDYWSFLESRRGGAEIHVVRAENNLRWTQTMVDRLGSLSPSSNVRFHTLPDAGHWLHVDKPDALLEMLAPSFD